MIPEVVILGVVVIILSIIFHEVAHGYVANWLGDPTARLAGRLTLNPLPHIDPVGSVLVPAILALSSSPFLIGWAKPVPYNPYNLRHGKWGEALVAFAGPATNILIAVIAAVLVRTLYPVLDPLLVQVAVYTIISNVALAVINLIPIPPIDGSKIVRALLPPRAALAYARLEQATYALGPFGLIAVLLLIVYVFDDALGGLISGVVGLLLGA